MCVTNTFKHRSDNTNNDLITDPCGIAYHRGKWHIFYQYFVMGNNTRLTKLYSRVNWGHSTSDDMV